MDFKIGSRVICIKHIDESAFYNPSPSCYTPKKGEILIIAHPPHYGTRYYPEFLFFEEVPEGHGFHHSNFRPIEDGDIKKIAWDHMIDEVIAQPFICEPIS